MTGGTPLAADPPRQSQGLRLYVAVGDSFTAGSGCGPGVAWPERLTGALRGSSPGLELVNLAVHGATSAAVAGQVERAVDLGPDLVTLVCGANDIIGSTRPDSAAYARRLGEMIDTLHGRCPGVRVVTATAPERWNFLDLGPRTRARVEGAAAAFNSATRAVAAIHGAECLDVAGHAGLGLAENFAADGLHPSPLGHARAARGFVELIDAG